ncbi:MAG TPA: response regulator [Candidatus Dormibacteraeota bacterium]|nr:response regulator [Candidatus Dormibacteraeota bacterium]
MARDGLAAWWALGMGRDGVRRDLADRSGGGRGGRRILFVEDDEAMATMYQLRLQNDGYEVVWAGDGEDGLAQALEGDFDLVLLDLGLPRLDGLAVLTALRQQRSASELPVAILSNYDEPPMVRQAQSLGVSDYLVKAETTPSRLAEAIAGWIGS